MENFTIAFEKQTTFLQLDEYVLKILTFGSLVGKVMFGWLAVYKHVLKA